MSILKQLFDGDYYPSEQVVPQSDEYKSKRTACNIALRELQQALGGEDDPGGKVEGFLQGNGILAHRDAFL